MDYIGMSHRLTVSSPGGRECINITVVDDADIELQEYFTVQLIHEGSIYDYSATVYIQDNDEIELEQSSFIVEDTDIIMATLEQSVYNVNEDIGFVEVCANLKTKIGTSSSQWMLTTVPYHTATDVDYAGVNPTTIPDNYSTATEGVDYIGVHRTFTVHSPETKQCINITIVDDNQLENYETIFIQLRFGSVEWSRAFLPIADNDGDFTLSASSVNENAGFVEICGDFNISTQKIATFRTQTSFARDGVDFIGLHYSTTVSPGEKKCVNITILDDVEREHTQKCFGVYLRVDSQERGHYLSIYDDDSNIMQRSLHTITESTGFVRVCLEYTDITTAEIVTARNGTATENQDYVPVTHTFTASSDGRECITITILNDAEIEYKEYIPVELRFSGIVYSTSYVIIEDDDTARLERSSYTVKEGDIFAEVCAIIIVETIYENDLENFEVTLSTLQDRIGSDFATEGHDYIGTSRTFINPRRRECIRISIVDDTELEFVFGESFQVQLKVGARHIQSAPIFIEDDDDGVITLQALSRYEGAGFIEVCATFRGTVNTEANIWTNYFSAGAADYIQVGYTFNVSSLQQTECISITLVDDADLEIREYFDVYLSVGNLLYSTIHPYLEDNDGVATLEQSSYTVTESSGSVEICAIIDINQGTNKPTMYLYTVSGSAKDGSDFIGTRHIFNVSSLSQKECFNITVIDDRTVEVPERFGVSLNDFISYTRFDYVSINILDNDVAWLEPSSYTVQESSGSVEVCAIFELNTDTGSDQAEASFITTDGTSTEEMDYIGMSHSFNVSSPGGRKCINITVIDDADIESLEYFFVKLLHEGSVYSRTARVYIQDNDVVEFEQSSYTVQESSGSVEVCAIFELIADTGSDQTEPSFITTDGTSTEEMDYIGMSRRLTVSSPGGRKCINITVIDDAAIESLEHFTVQLMHEGSVYRTARVYIQDNDVCGGTIIADRGSITSPNWPETYLTNTDCEWTIELQDQSKAIHFSFDTSVYGIAGEQPCTSDWVEIGHRGALPIGRYCSTKAPTDVTSSAYAVNVSFHAGPQYSSRQKGFKMNFFPISRPKGLFTCGRLLSDNTPFGPPDFPALITSRTTRNKCVWRYIGQHGTRAQLKLYFFDIPESNGCSQSSMTLHYQLYTSGAPDKTLCGALTEYIFVSTSRLMTITLNIDNRNTFRGFHAVIEQPYVGYK